MNQGRGSGYVMGVGVIVKGGMENIERNEDMGVTYLLVASSSTSIELCLKSACARQKSCF